MELTDLLVITGPTATGKTRLGVLLAKKTGGEVVSADSMQLYRHMDIGTAKPSAEEACGIPHHMVDVLSPFEKYSVARYVEESSACIRGIQARDHMPIVVGGTGLYIDSLLSGRDFAEGEQPEIRQALNARYDRLGGEALLEELRAIDPDSAQKLHSNDRKRIVRALEVFALTGKIISEHNAETRERPPRYRALKIALTFRDRDDLYARINRRVDDMMAKGLLDEVRGLLQMGLLPEHTAMQAIGYKELVQALTGSCTVPDAVERIKQESRRYAKRQLSWLRRDQSVRWILWEKEPDFEAGLHHSTRFLEEFGYNIAAEKQI